MNFCIRLKSIRQESKLTQKDVCTYLKCSLNAYASYEQGRTEPSIEMLRKLSDILKISLDDLINGTI